MAEPQIDINNNRNNETKLLIMVGLVLLLIVTAISLSFFKGSTQLGKVAKGDIYEPDKEGFVNKANDLFAQLLTITDPTVAATDLEGLNKHYKALEFALPYSSEQKPVIEASDLRLVKIKPEYMNEEQRRFYFNSRLPQLLQQQAGNICETYFKIKSRALGFNSNSQAKPIEINKIEVLSSMFKLALAKDPWKGSILSAKNVLFPEEEARFLTFGSSMLPIPISDELSHSITHCTYRAITDDCLLRSNNNGKTIDYYELYKEAFDKKKKDPARRVELKLYSDSATTDGTTVSIVCTKDSISTLSEYTIEILQNGKERLKMKPELYGGQKRVAVKYSDGMKIVVYSNEQYKVAEFTINKQDPTHVLSCLINTSTGKSRYNLPPNQSDLFTQQIIRGLSRHMSNKENIDTINLSIDPILSLQFEEEIKNYLTSIKKSIKIPNNQKKQQYDISLTIMDLYTGEILACPFYTDKFDSKDYPEKLKLTTRNPALSRRYPGSTFKPILALAAVQACPSLLELNTSGRYSLDLKSSSQKNPLEDPHLKANFFGWKTKAWAKKTNHWVGTDFEHFLSHSDDVYPVALSAIALAGCSGIPDNPLPIGGNRSFLTHKNKNLWFKNSNQAAQTASSHPFTHWLTYITGSNYNTNYNKDLNLFKNLSDYENRNNSAEYDFGLDEISPDITNLHIDRFKNGMEFRDNLVPWVLGQGDNEWSSIMIAQAWCRMLSKHNITANLVKGTTSPEHLLKTEPINIPGCLSKQGKTRSLKEMNETWNGFLSKWNDAQGLNYSGNTLRAMNNEVKNLERDLILFSKTGTPDEYQRYDFPMLNGNNRFFDIGMYTFGLMKAEQYKVLTKGNERPHGIVCVVRITRTYECNSCRNMGKKCPSCKNINGIKSSHARDLFVENGGARLHKLYDMTYTYF